MPFGAVLRFEPIIAALILSMLLPCLGIAAQQPAKVARVGYLVIGALESPATRLRIDSFRQGLRELGYIEGQNIVIDYRAADGRIERLPGLASELVRAKPDIIVAVATAAARAAKQATSTIPIVATAMGEPVNDGLVASLARPGGNMTGTAFLGPELVPKRLELIKESVPNASRVAGLWHSGAFSERTTNDMLDQAKAAARSLGLQLHLTRVQGPDELTSAFAAIAKERVDALVVFPSPMLYSERDRIVELSAKNRLPAIFNARESVEIGGLMAYGASLDELNRRAATYVDKILKGAKPADLPVEQPTTFELAINLRTAKSLGLTIPQTVLFRADHVIR